MEKILRPFSRGQRKREFLVSSKRSQVSKILSLAWIALALSIHSAEAASESRPLVVRWTSIAGFLLDDGETTLAFDPVFTRPGVAHWLGMKKLIPDQRAVEENLAALQLNKVDAVFASHEHFDHAVDASEIAHRFEAKMFGGLSLERIARANSRLREWKDLHFQRVGDRETVRVGKFQVKFYRRTHAAIFPSIGFSFLPGEVSENFNFGFYQYREGEVWCWKITHPSGKIFVDQGSQFFSAITDELKGIPNFILGVANKRSVEDFVENSIGAFRPKRVIPLHFDNFLGSFSRENMKFLPGIEYPAIVKKAGEVSPSTEIRLPKFGEPITLD